MALAHILENHSEVVPSFHRLSANYKSLIIHSLSIDFQFNQFLQAEIVPSNLVVVKEKLQQHGEEGYSLFCFRIFAQMCGKLGYKSNHGSLFMTESQFQKFRPGETSFSYSLQRLRFGGLDAAEEYGCWPSLQCPLKAFSMHVHHLLLTRDSVDLFGQAFLLLRGSKVLSRFASWQHQARPVTSELH